MLLFAKKECVKRSMNLTSISSLKGDGHLLVNVDALRELQSAMGEELRPLFGRTLLPSVLDKAFKGEL